jgi:drug/metabolite transporter (DMT)-like permease
MPDNPVYHGRGELQFYFINHRLQCDTQGYTGIAYIYHLINNLTGVKVEWKAYGMIHLAVVAFAFTAILGAAISLPALTLVWWRVMIAGISLTFFTKGITFLKKLSTPDLLRFTGIGSLIAIHWLAFFASVKIAGASVCLICMATTCIFVSIIEPLILNQSFNRLNLILAGCIVPGMYFVVQSVGAAKYSGIAAGLFSAFLAGVFSSLNKKYIHQVTVWQMSWIEMWSAFATLSIVMIAHNFLFDPIAWKPNVHDWTYLLILGFICTTLAHALSLFALRHLSAFALNLVINLEPVYGVILAALILAENKKLSTHFYFGAALIMISVFVYPYIQKKYPRVT